MVHHPVGCQREAVGRFSRHLVQRSAFWAGPFFCVGAGDCDGVEAVRLRGKTEDRMRYSAAWREKPGGGWSGGHVNSRTVDKCGQATKGTWGMSWRQKARKGVEDCEKLGGAVKQVLIPR